MTSKKYYLLKFLNKKWADKMMDGEIFFRAIECFGNPSNRNTESKYKFHGDLLGGINYTDGVQFGLIDVLTLREKIYCLSALEFVEELNCFITPDKGMRKFGDTAVLIHNPIEFLHRICNAMIARFDNDFWTSFNMVDYNVNFSENQPYDVFCKASEYEYQKEFRIALDLADGRFAPSILKDITDFAKKTFVGEIIEDVNPESISDELILNIGNIRDICISVPSSELLNGNHNKVLTPPMSITPLVIPRAAKPTFFKMVANLP